MLGAYTGGALTVATDGGRRWRASVSWLRAREQEELVYPTYRVSCIADDHRVQQQHQPATEAPADSNEWISIALIFVV